MAQFVMPRPKKKWFRHKVNGVTVHSGFGTPLTSDEEIYDDKEDFDRECPEFGHCQEMAAANREIDQHDVGVDVPRRRLQKVIEARDVLRGERDPLLVPRMTLAAERTGVPIEDVAREILRNDAPEAAIEDARIASKASARAHS